MGDSSGSGLVPPHVSDLGVACPRAVRWLQLDSWLIPMSLAVILQQAGSALFTAWPHAGSKAGAGKAIKPSAWHCHSLHSLGQSKPWGWSRFSQWGLLQSDMSKGTDTGRTVISVTYHIKNLVLSIFC